MLALVTLKFAHPRSRWQQCFNIIASCNTSTNEADGAEEASLRIVHLKRQKLTSKGKHQVSERTEASIMHLSPVEG